MIPVKIKIREPHALGGACNAGWCRGDDWQEYVLKDASVHPLIPHNEWFCTRLAASAGVLCPPCSAMEESPTSFIFGSAWEGGVLSDDLIEVVNRGDIQRAMVSSVLSRILAFDHFVHNIDRSTANYVIRNTKYSHVIMAIDFDKSWLYHGFPLPRLPFSKESNTRYFYNYIRSIIGDFLAIDEVNSTLDSLKSVQQGKIESIIREHPDEWLPTNIRNQVLSWWASEARVERIEAIRKGIGDGSFL